MNEEMLIWMNRTYPDGFFCADLTNSSGSRPPFEALSMLELPLLLHLRFSQLQELISNLMEQGISPNTACFLPQNNISSTLGTLLLKLRPLRLDELFLVIGD
ncbi:MAG: hypothetical protein ACRD4B_02135 [Acidobacteriota bacterium]